MTKIDPALQAQVDSQLMEQGAFTPLELLINAGRLISGDYESWRRREIELLDSVLMGSRDKIQAQIEAAVSYARSIGLVEQTQEFHAWRTEARDLDNDHGDHSDKALRISADPQLHRLIAGRYAPAQSIPQMDLFFDNPVVALTNGIVRALSARNVSEAQRQLDRLYAQAPNHADLAAFDRLLAALGRPSRAIDDPRQEIDFLREITPTARRLLGSQSRDLLAPLWRRLADALEGRALSPDEPELHASFALCEAQDWTGVRDCVMNVSDWRLHAPLCLRLARSSFYRQHRVEAVMAWCHLCWRAPRQAADILDQGRQPDARVNALWLQFVEIEEDSWADDANAEAALTAADFPAWLLLHEPGLALQLAEDLPTGDTPGEEHYRCVHRWLQARRANRQADEIAQRKILQASQPGLFRYLKKGVMIRG